MKQVVRDMNNIKKFSIAGFCICMLIASNVSSSEVDGYQCVFRITDGQQSVRQFDLNLDVYRCMQHSGHKDLAVVNADNQMVPFSLSTQSQAVDLQHYDRELNFYQEPDATSYKTGKQIKRIANLTGVVSGNESDTQWLDKNTYYSSLILEQEKNDDQLKSITIKSNETNVPISVTVIIEASNDLQNWTTLLAPHNLYYLPGVNNGLQSNVLKLNASIYAKYLRLATLSNVDNFTHTIGSISGEYEKTSYIPAPLEWSVMTGMQSLAKEGEWSMALDDLRPISRIRFTPAENIVYYQGAIYTKYHINPVTQSEQKYIRDDAKKKIKTLIKNTVHDPHVPVSSDANPWRHATRFTQYRIKTDNGSTASPEIRITPIQSRNWKFTFDQPLVTSPSQLPEIEFGWQPQQVKFIAQGAGPFYLMAGSTDVPSRPSLPGQLLSLSDSIEPVEIHASALPVEVEDEKPLSTAFDIKKILLWLTLLVGVSLMAAMAYQLAIKMKSDS